MTFEGAFKNLLSEKKTNLVANELKKGDKVKNINPDCQHCGTEGKVVKTVKRKGKGGICGTTVIYKVQKDPLHNGEYKGKSIEKTEIQLKKEQVEADLKPVPKGKFDPIELEKGIKIEMEHTKDRKTAETIAKQHLSERPDYYKRLNKYVEKTIHDPVRPGILKRAAGGGKLSCSKARAVKARQKNKGNNTAKAAQRYLNYHC
jgi:hypothetical protein